MLRSCFLSNFFESRSAVSEKSKMSQSIMGHGGHLFLPIRSKNTDLVKTLRSCFLSSFVEFCSVVSEKKSKMSQPIRGWGGHLVFPISPKNTNLVEDVEILLPVKFRLNSVLQFQTRSRKCLSQSEARAAILFFRSARKTQTW